jgi:Bacteriophage lambda head decoration protein D
MGQLTTNYDTSKIFIWNNRYETGTYTNPTGAEVSLLAGTLMGRVATTQKLKPCVSSASDGSQFPVGILADDYAVDYGESATVTICISGDVAEGKVILGGSDTLSTVVSSRSLRDRIAADTMGIKLVSSTEMTAEDNQ